MNPLTRWIYKTIYRPQVIYILMRHEQLVFADVMWQRTLIETPVVARKKSARSDDMHGALFGKEALADRNKSEYILVNGFEHPRTLISDFVVAEATIKAFLNRFLGRVRGFAIPPVLVLHPQLQLDGELTPIEQRAFVKLGRATGALSVYLWTGRELTPAELLKLKFPESGGQLSAESWT